MHSATFKNFTLQTCNKKEVLPTPEFPISNILNMQSKFMSLYSAPGLLSATGVSEAVGAIVH